MIEPILSILVLTIESRRDLRRDLFENLRHQAQREAGHVEVLVYEDDGRLPSGTKRNTLLQSAKGRYVAFVDDDDQVSNEYVSNIIQTIHYYRDRNPDVVTFDLERSSPNQPPQRMTFDLHYKDHVVLPNGQIGMTANHLCAWKRTIASQVCFIPSIGYNDDVFWYSAVIASGAATSEYHIDKVLYSYRWNPSETYNQRQDIRNATYKWAAGGVEVYRYRENIVYATQGKQCAQSPSPLTSWPDEKRMNLVFDRHGATVAVRESELNLLCTVHAR